MEIGFLFMIEPNGLWKNLDICELTDKELNDILLAERSPQWLRMAIIQLVEWIKENTKEQAIK